MADQEKIAEMVRDYVQAAKADYVGLWQIAIRVRHDFGISNRAEIRRRVMQIVEDMLSAGVEAVTLKSAGPGCTPLKNQNLDYVLDRITSEWDHLDRDPNPGEIVWFNSPNERRRQPVGRN
jgi:hypothetical protein